MQVRRQRRPVTTSRCTTLRSRRPARLLIAGLATVAVAGGGAAYANTKIFSDHQVGTTYANGIQVSSDQILKPIGDRLLTQQGKFMGSTLSPDGKFLAATSTDKSVVLQIFDLSTYKQIWTVGSAAGVNQKLTDGTVGQEGPTYSPDGKFLLLAREERAHPVPGQRRRHARRAVHLPDPRGRRPLPAARKVDVLR